MCELLRKEITCNDNFKKTTTACFHTRGENNRKARKDSILQHAGVNPFKTSSDICNLL